VPVVNAMRERMASGGPALGLGLRQARTADIGRAMATAGLDWLFVDLEHNAMGLDTAVQICVAAQDAGITPIVRVPDGDVALACRALDGGAMGIVMPHVQDGEQAQAFARACRFPPAGERGVAAAIPQTAFAPLPLAEGLEQADRAVLLFAMVETAEAARHADAIAATPGVDGILVGCQDLCMDLGIPGEVGDEAVTAVVAACVEACGRHGKWAGLAGVAEPALIAERVAAGIDFALLGNDLGLLMAAVAQRVAQLRPVAAPR
jgi:4-hydroxy-2-oxoheptanedioate aldolase